jgi:sRNA-binding regulator protein Hfq
MAKKKAKRVDINAEPSLLEDIDRSVREQNRFLDYCVAHNIEITLYLESGTQFIGFINGYDLKCILLGAKNVKKPARLILKSYISLIRANAPIELFIEYRGLGTAKTRKRKKRTEL